jgi:zinc/manganese transport system substrate-binding protein
MKWCVALLMSWGLVHAAPLKVACLSTIADELARKVGGSEVQVDSLVKPGIDPHEFEPSTSDMKTISAAQVILAMGKGLEGYLTKLEETTRVPLIQIGSSIPSLASQGETEGHSHAGEDPHWWNSVQNMKRATEIVRVTFTQLRPESRRIFAINAEKYQNELDGLNQWARRELAALPRDQRKLVTSHDAFQYFARDWGFQVYPIEGITPKEEPSSQKVAALIGLIKAEKVKAIFAEKIENPKVLREITRETGAVLGGELYADGLGTGEASTYDAMMRHNITTLIQGLK